MKTKVLVDSDCSRATLCKEQFLVDEIPKVTRGRTSGMSFLWVLLLLLFVIPVSVLAQTVSVDKVDYFPGDKVTASGKGWLAYEQIDLKLVEQIFNNPGVSLTVSADAYGKFSKEIYTVVEADRGAFFHLTATGKTSGQVCTTVFNDAGGDYGIDFAAYDPTKYVTTSYLDFIASNPLPFGRAASPLQPTTPGGGSTDHSGTDESLMPKDLGLGQIVPFEFFIKADSRGDCFNDKIRFTGEWMTVTTNGNPFGYDGSLGVVAAFVCTGSHDNEFIDPAGNATVTNVDWTLDGNTIIGTVDVTGLDPGDALTVEVWVVLQRTIGNAGGNVKSRLTDAATIGSCEPGKINTGNQEVPLLRVGDFTTTDVDVLITKQDLGADVYRVGENFTYEIAVTNNGPSVANQIVVTDVLDPNTTFVSPPTYTDTQGSGWTYSISGGTLTFNSDFLNVGETAKINLTVHIGNSAPRTGTGGEGVCVTGADLCNNVSVTTISQDTNLANNSDSEPTGVMCTDLTVGGVITPLTCFGESTGAINITVNGGAFPYTFAWSNGSALEDLTGLPAGIYTVNVLDATGCPGTATFTILDPPVVPPVITGVGGPLTIECPAEPVFSEPVATDADGTVELTFADVTAPGTCPGAYIITRTWTATDNCGNKTTASQIITVIDTTPPVITGVGGPITQECNLPVVFSEPVATDLCGDVILTSEDVTVAGDCANESIITRTWTATDACGNKSYASQVITIVDTTKPVWVQSYLPPSLVVACDVPAPDVLTATDLCGRVEVVFNEVENLDDCGEGTVTRTWTATDLCGNFITHTQVITIEREDFTLPVNGSSIVACRADAVEPVPPSVEDNCGNTIKPSDPVVGGTYDGCEGTITYTFTYIDCEKNSHNWVYTYTVEAEDFTLPVNGSSIVACKADAVVPVPPSVEDNCGNPITPSDPVVGGTYDGCEGTITYTFTYIDCEKNSHNWVYTYTVEAEDFTLPANGRLSVVCVEESEVIPTPPQVFDNCGNLIRPTGPVVTDSDMLACGGTRTYAWTYTDCENNSHIWSFVYEINDTVDPVLNAIPEGMTLCEGESISLALPTATDNCLGVVPVTFIVKDSNGSEVSGFTLVNGFIVGTLIEPGVYTVFFMAVDACENDAVAITVLNYPDPVKALIPNPGYEHPLCGNYQNNLLTVEVTGGTPAYTYKWHLDAYALANGWSIIGDDNKATVNFAAGSVAATFTVDIIDANSCETSATYTMQPCQSEYYCTYTQGFYGNRGGYSCSTDGRGATAAQIMQSVLPVGKQQIFGLVSTNRYFVLTGTDIYNGSIFNMLPGGGTSAPLGYMINGSTYSNVSTWGVVPLSKAKSTYGKIGNNLLSQTIALYFNIGLNDNRPMNGSYELSSFMLRPTIVTADSKDCGEIMVLPMRDQFVNISQRVIDYLNSNYSGGATVGNLLDLANRMLGGDPALVQFANGNKVIYLSVTPTEVTAAIDAINNIFDECRINVPQELQNLSNTLAARTSSPETVESETDGDNGGPYDIEVSTYPNPFVNQVTIEFTSPVDTWAVLQVITLDGRKIETLFEGEVKAGQTEKAVFEPQGYTDGVYVYRLSAGTISKVGKILTLKK